MMLLDKIQNELKKVQKELKGKNSLSFTQIEEIKEMIENLSQSDVECFVKAIKDVYMRDRMKEDIDFLYTLYLHDDFLNQVWSFSQEPRKKIASLFYQKIEQTSMEEQEKEIAKLHIARDFDLKEQEVILDILSLTLKLLEKDILGKKEYDPIIYFERFRKINLCNGQEEVCDKILTMLHHWYQEKGREIYSLEEHPLLDDEEDGVDYYANLQYLFEPKTIIKRRENYLKQFEKEFEILEKKSSSRKIYYMELNLLYNKVRRALGYY